MHAQMTTVFRHPGFSCLFIPTFARPGITLNAAIDNLKQKEKGCKQF